jgi:hypothetical protein
MNSYQPRFPALYEHIKRMHAESKTGEYGHGLDHDVLVAEFAVHICPDPTYTNMVWVAGILHSLDRVVGDEAASPAISDALEIVRTDFKDEQRTEILEAVLRHSELNRDDQSLTQIVLMDADRLANLQMAIPIRAGQFRPSIPPLETEYLDTMNPESTYRAPKSVLDDLRHGLQWVAWLRTPKAQELGREAEANIKNYLDLVAKPYRLLGLAGKKL